MPKVSVVIPCYNQGHFLDEAVDSVLSQGNADVEIIVVNDGSTDLATISKLEKYSRKHTRVIHTENKGLAAARNRGITESKGEYIFPLDADDKIKPGYLDKAISVLDEQPGIGIVYARATLFGAVETEWLLPQYSLEEMLLDNVIYCSALFRKKDWLTVGGYDTELVYGWEDYDLWLSIIELGLKVHQLDEILFCYRVASDSMVRSIEKWQKVECFTRIYHNHQKLYSENINVWISKLIETREKYYTSRVYVDCGAGISDQTSVSRKVDTSTFLIEFELSGYRNIQGLRFDPIDTPSVVELLHLDCVDCDGKQSELKVAGDNALLRQQNKYYFATDDPQFHLELDNTILKNISSLTVRLRFHALDQDALQQIVKAQAEQLNKLRFVEKPFELFKRSLLSFQNNKKI